MTNRHEIPTSAAAMIEMARTELLIRETFFGTLSMMLEPTVRIIGDGEHRAPMATDGKHLFYDPEMIEKFSIDEVKAGIAHETLHLGFGHVRGHIANRTGARNSKIWNYVCDVIINELLRDNGFTLPPNVLYVEKLKWRPPLDKPVLSYCAEELYPRLVIEEMTIPLFCGLMDPASGEGSADGGEGLGNEPWRPSDAEVEIWKSRMNAAAQQAKQAGKMPGGIEEIIEGLYKPQKNWIQELVAYVQRILDDFTWMPPDRRCEALSEEIGYEVILPSLSEGERIMDLVIGMDTSGSMSEIAMRRALTEIQAIAMVGINLHLAYCDAALQYWGELDTDLPIPKGRGGTAFQPVFDQIENLGLDCAGLVYFTDGYGPFPEHPPHYPTIWCINNEEVTPPWGTVIRIDPSEDR